MISVAQAQAQILAAAKPLEHEKISINDAVGRVLAKEEIATRAQPPFDASAMDGFAVRRADIHPGTALKVVGQSAAGHGFKDELPQNSAIRIFTGAPVPYGADFILIQENTEQIDPHHIRVKEINEQSYVRPMGMDFKTGFAIKAQTEITAPTAMVLAAMNIAHVTVYRRPHVAILSTGDELVRAGDTPTVDQIIESNHIGISHIAKEIGATVSVLPILRDDKTVLSHALELCQNADVVVLSGGASVGDHDFTAPALRDHGVLMDFHKVKMRPGKPLMFGTRGAQCFLGLPGNPVSSIVCSLLFLAPLLHQLQGVGNKIATTQQGKLIHDISPNGNREHYMRAFVENGDVRVFENQDSSLLTTLSRANALAVRPPDAPAMRAGQTIPYILI